MTVTVHALSSTTALTAADIEPWRQIPAAVAADLVGDLGRIDPAIRPLNPPGKQPRLFGRAVTALCAPPDFTAIVHAMDIIGPGDVLMVAAGGNAAFAMLGEIIGGHLRHRGCSGLVCDGAIRDVGTLAGWTDFSVFARSVTPRGPVAGGQGAVNLPVSIGGQMVHPGDLVIGDDDGLVVLSPERTRAHIQAAQAKLVLESQWIESLASGRSAAETFGLPAPRTE